MLSSGNRCLVALAPSRREHGSWQFGMAATSLPELAAVLTWIPQVPPLALIVMGSPWVLNFGARPNNLSAISAIPMVVGESPWICWDFVISTKEFEYIA